MTDTKKTVGQQIAEQVVNHIGSNTVKRGGSPLDVTQGLRKPVPEKK